MIWVGIISLIRELLVGQQGVLHNGLTNAWPQSIFALRRLMSNDLAQSIPVRRIWDIASQKLWSLQHAQVEFHRGGDTGHGTFIQSAAHALMAAGAISSQTINFPINES